MLQAKGLTQQLLLEMVSLDIYQVTHVPHASILYDYYRISQMDGVCMLWREINPTSNNSRVEVLTHIYIVRAPRTSHCINVHLICG